MQQFGSIIIDGSDQQGKSTLCNKLNAVLGYPVYHFAPPKPGTDFMREYLEPMLKTSDPYIFDRSYMSEMVYGELFRGGSGVTPVIQKYIENFLNGRHCIYVYLKRKNYQWEDRPEMYTKDQNLLVIQKFDEVYPKIGIPKIQIDAFDTDAVERIVEFYNKINGIQ